MSKETHKERSLRAIEVITSAKNEIKEIFADTPELQIRAINTLQRLANGFAHSAGIQMQFDATSGSGEVKTPQFLTHIAGVPITRKEVKKVADAKPTTDEEKELEGFLELAMDDFKVLEPEELMDSYNELVLRALAKKVGLNVTATEPAIIDVAFVENMKETIIKMAPKADNPEGEKAPEVVADAKPTTDEEKDADKKENVDDGQAITKKPATADNKTKK